MTVPDLDRLLRPRSIAVLGGTSRETGLGSRTLRHLRDAGFPGEVIPCRSAAELTGPVDVTVVSVPAHAVPEVLAGVDGRTGFAVVYSSGFEEVGGAALRTRHGTRVVGPNTVGLYHAPSRNVLTFAQAFDDLTGCQHGSGAFLVSQSGAFGARLVRSAARYGLHLDGFVGTGNETDLDACSIGLGLLAGVHPPRVLMLYLEGLRDPDGLIALLSAARHAEVRVVVLLGGLTAAGSAAAASHTAAVSSDHAVVTELLSFYGATLVHDDRELVQTALGAALLRRAAGRRVGVVTGSGGAGVVAADVLAGRGFTLPPLSAGLRATLDAQLPDIATTNNPVDVTAQAIGDDGTLDLVCTALRDSGEVDLVLVVGRTDQAPAAGAIVGTAVPTVVAVLDRDASGVRARIEEGELVLPDLASACVALTAAAPPVAGEGVARPAPLSAGDAAPREPLTAAESVVLVEKAGVPVAPWRLVTSAGDVEEFGDAVGWPVVLKADLPARVHKAAAGGVRLDVDRESARRQAGELLAGGRPVIAAKQLRASLELFVGVRRDEQWGLVVSAGLGGAHIELLDRTVAMPARLPVSWLARRLAETLFARVPDRYAGLAGELATVAATLTGIAEAGGFHLVECNPLGVVDGHVVALDARVVSR